MDAIRVIRAVTGTLIVRAFSKALAYRQKLLELIVRSVD